MLALYKGWDIEEERLLGLFPGLLKNFVTKKHLFFGIFWHKIDYFVFGRRVGGGKTNTILVCVEFSAHYCVCHLPDISKNKLHYD